MALSSAGAAAADDESAFSTKPIPMKTDKELPARTPPILEIGPKFLGRGNLPEGIVLPTGAVWQPALWVFGDYRTALQYFDNGSAKESDEWVNRLDLFSDLQFTPTERILLGISPLNKKGKFTGYSFTGTSHPDSWDSEFNANITTFFFEGDFGEIFPNLDPNDRHAYDYGFSIGRQPIFFQEGIMVNDTMDALAITRNNLTIPGWSPNSRVTALWSWGSIDRNNNKADHDAQMFGLFTETDFRVNTLNVDFSYVTSTRAKGGDVGVFGIGTTQRVMGVYNTALWADLSWAPDIKSAVANNGALLFSEISRTLPRSDDVVYFNAFWGINNFTSAARNPTAGGPLGQVGILFASAGIGSYGAPLSNAASKAAGGAVGYQMFFNNERTQLVLELGGRVPTISHQKAAIALGSRLQFALWDRYRLEFDGFVSDQEGGNTGAGLRSEFTVQF